MKVWKTVTTQLFPSASKWRQKEKKTHLPSERSRKTLVDRVRLWLFDDRQYNCTRSFLVQALPIWSSPTTDDYQARRCCIKEKYSKSLCRRQLERVSIKGLSGKSRLVQSGCWCWQHGRQDNWTGEQNEAQDLRFWFGKGLSLVLPLSVLLCA